MRFSQPLQILCTALLAGTGLALLWRPPGVPPIRERLPAPSPKPARSVRTAATKIDLSAARVRRGPGRPGPDLGDWPQFRGPHRDGRRPAAAGLARSWPPSGPVKLWEIEVGEGHAGPAVHRGRVYLMDYDRAAKCDLLRCLSLEDGQDIWRFAWPMPVKRNHGISRTVPAVTDKFVVGIGPKCMVYCLDAVTGKPAWVEDMVRRFGTRVPPWYAGQCPLIDGNAVILAPGGQPLMLAQALDSGKILWKTPNPGGWGMTHSSIVRLDFPGAPQYVYCTTRGVVGVRAKDGRLLWKWTGWRIAIANIPTPVVVDSTRLFFSGGYRAGAVLVQVTRRQGAFQCIEKKRWPASVFGAEQQTPILRGSMIYGVLPAPTTQFACLDLDSGKRLWTSGKKFHFGLGPYLMAGGLAYVLNDESGELVLAQASPEGWRALARAKVLNGSDAWGPMALVDGRLLLRDLTHLACIRVGREPERLSAAAPADPNTEKRR